MTRTRTTILLAAILLALALPGAASAEYLVPEGNSAVSQYTEGVPSAGGEKGTRNGEFKEPVSAGKTIGAGNAKKLAEAGPEGEEAAQVAAETAPPQTTSGEGESSEAGGGNHGGGGKQGGGSGGGGQGGGNQGGSGQSNGGGQGGGATEPEAGGESGGGNSGIGSVLAAATGSEDGHLGLLLPLIVLAALAGGTYYALRQRNRAVPR